jgi:hypothetical protein
MASQPNSIELYCAWNLICDLASKTTPQDRRGYLERDNIPLSPGDMACCAGFPADMFERALEFFSRPCPGWLCVESPGTPAESPGESGKSPAVGKGREGKVQNGIEGNGIDEKKVLSPCKHGAVTVLSPCPPSSPSPSPAPASAPYVRESGNHSFPSLKDCCDEAEMRCIPKDHAEAFFNHFEAVGWLTKNNQPITNWRVKLQSWSTTERGKAAPINGSSSKDAWKESLRTGDMPKGLTPEQESKWVRDYNS